MSSQITAMHYCIQRTCLTNDDLTARFEEKQIRSIAKMSSVRERRVVTPGQTASDLAFHASKRSIEGSRYRSSGDRPLDLRHANR